MRVALLLVFCLASAPAFGSDATDLVDLVVAAYGGAETIERSKSLKQSGALESYRHGKTGTVERIFSRPDRLRVDIKIPGAPPESRILNGEQGWRDGKEVPPMMARAMLLQAARLDLPYLIMKAGQDIKMLGPINRDDHRDVKGLEVPMEDGLRMIAVVDAKTGYIISSHGLIEIAPNRGMEFTTFYTHHEQMNGMVLATEEAHFAQGQPTGKTTLNQSEIVQDVPDTTFRP